MKYFLAEKYHSILKFNDLDGFDTLWHLDLEQVDKPNKGHGGWSTVSKLILCHPDGNKKIFYLKRQENYKLHSFVFPLMKVASFDREIRRFFQLAKKGIPVSTPVYYEKRQEGGGTRAILMIENLDGYRDLNHCLKDLKNEERTFLKKKRLIKAVATVIRRLHKTGYQHGMLFGKHIFIKGNSDFSTIDVRLIDLEFVRWHPNRVIKDLARLYKKIARVAPHTPPHDYIRFLKCYMQEETLTLETRRIICKIQNRIEKENRRKK